MRRIVFPILLLLLTIFPSYSLDTHWDLEPAVIKIGLNNPTIYDICYGNNGFMWLSTDKGITRYDGLRFRDYPLIMSVDSLSTPLPQAVKTLHETSDGLFYILLYEGGIACFDEKKESFLPIYFNKPFKLRDVLDFYWDDETLYMATSQGLYESRVIRDKDGKEDAISCTLNPEPLLKGKITNLCSDGKGNLYFSVDGMKVVHYNVMTKKSSLIKEYGIVGRLFLKNGYLWICRLWDDIVCYDLKKGKERVISMGAIDQVDYSNSYITDLVAKDNKTFYLTTWDGLFKLNFENENLCESSFTLKSLTRYQKLYRSNIESKMTSVLWDNKQKILWAGTFGGGIVKFDLSDSMYSRVQQDFNSRVNGMVEDARGYIWLAMADGGIMKSVTPSLSMNTQFERWKKTSGFSGRYNIYKDKNANIWLGNNKGEVVFINPVTEDVVSFSLKDSDGEKIQTTIYGFCLDSRNRLWVASSSGLILVDPESRISQKTNLSREIENVYAVVEDKEGNIWIGTNKGLKRVETEGTEFRLIGNYEAENGLEEAAVRTVYVNNYNQIYAVYLNMVVRIDGREKDKLESIYTLQNGLTSGHIACMIDDHIGNTWVGNNVGVMTIRNGQQAFYNYLSVGNCCAVCRLNDGRLLWANSWGLLFFDPAASKVEGNKKELMLTDIEVGGETILAGEEWNGQTILTVSPEKQKSLTFDLTNNDFRLYFSDLRYGMTQRKISYRLLPGDKEWRMMPLADGLWYNGLPSGIYTLQAKLVFPDGNEGDMIEIPITVKGKWYHSIWAYLAYGLLVIVFSYIFYRYLEKEDIQRQLHRDREMLLREHLTVEKMKQEQKQEIEAMRDRLLMLFVQELRTPLSLIIAPLKDLWKDKTLVSNLSFQVAYRNSLRMLDACDQLLAISGQGNLDVNLEIAPYPVEKMIDSNLFGVRELLKVYSIEFRCEKRIKKETEFYVDKKKVEFIIHNLLTNAFTHTHYAGTVVLTVCEIVKNETHYVSLVVEDDGKEYVKTAEQLFSEEKILETNLSAVQLGFTIMKQMVEAHHGNITLESSNGKGTKVTVNFPLNRDILESDSNITFIDPEELSDSEIESTTETQETSVVPANDNRKELQEQRISVETLVSEEVKSSTASGAKKTILIVEDHKDIRLYLKVLLGKEYNLLMATNGQEGIDLAVKELPDLIICDVMMPVKDGFECCKEVKDGLETCSIPFIMLTAKVEDDDIIHGLELGADDYVLKPFTPGILKAKVRNLINGRQTLKQMYTKLLMLPGADTAAVTTETEQVEDEVKMEDPFISSVVKIIEENICEADFSVKKLAAEMNMSQPTLYRKVKQSTDYTIIELIRGVRMRRAAVLLKMKQYAVQEVAEMVGYNDIPTFRKHFVDAFGTTPSTYE